MTLFSLSNIFEISPLFFLFPLFLSLYLLYYKKFSCFIYHQKPNPKTLDRNKDSNYLPGYPFGWFRVCDKDELKIGELKVISALGEHFMIFKNKEGKLFALDACCRYINMKGGHFIQENKFICCHIHKWILDGETGSCQLQEKGEKSDFLRQTSDHYRIWLIQESLHQIWIWFHPNPALRLKPLFTLLDEKKWDVEYRGYSMNLIHNHISEILENTADALHFNYVHSSFKGLNLIKYFYEVNWKKADDPKLLEYFKHKDDFQDKNRKKLISTHINKENMKYMQVNGLESYFTIPAVGFKYHFLTGTALHLGSNIIYYNFNSRFYDVLFVMTAIPLSEYEQKFTVTVFANKKMPFFVSAPLIYGEMLQMTNDGEIWDQKINPKKLYYNKYGVYDRMFIEWRNFYAQFLETQPEEENK